MIRIDERKQHRVHAKSGIPYYVILEHRIDDSKEEAGDGQAVTEVQAHFFTLNFPEYSTLRRAYQHSSSNQTGKAGGLPYQAELCLFYTLLTIPVWV